MGRERVSLKQQDKGDSDDNQASNRSRSRNGQ
jgi:hypothetical protein